MKRANITERPRSVLLCLDTDTQLEIKVLIGQGEYRD